MRIMFQRISDDRHLLAIVREDGSREQVECETRSYLVHDLLHYAVETEAGLDGGFWGNLAKGATLAALNDRSGRPMSAPDSELGQIEPIVGALTGTLKGGAAAEVVAGVRAYLQATAAAQPAWLSEAFVAAVQERMRRLLGHWRATGHGGSMELAWPGGARPAQQRPADVEARPRNRGA